MWGFNYLVINGYLLRFIAPHVVATLSFGVTLSTEGSYSFTVGTIPSGEDPPKA